MNTEMQIDEAVHIAQKCVQQAKAFEKLEEVLKIVKAAEQRVREAKTDRKNLDSDIDTKRGLLKELELAITVAEPAKAEATKSLAEHKERVQQEHDDTLEKARDEFNDILENLVVKRREAEEAHTLAINELAADEKSAQARVDKLRKILADLKKTASVISE